MGYFTRILGTQDPDISIDELAQSLKADGLSAEIHFDLNERPNKWTILDISNGEGEQIAQLERNAVLDDEPGQVELIAFDEAITNTKPLSAVKWLRKIFGKVKVIYVFHLLETAFENDNFEIIGSIRQRIWNRTGGILQADNQGFSNEEGYHILWQFNDDVSGEWDCAVQAKAGKWEAFTMDLEDPAQREDFMNGKVPGKARRL